MKQMFLSEINLHESWRPMILFDRDNPKHNNVYFILSLVLLICLYLSYSSFELGMLTRKSRNQKKEWSIFVFDYFDSFKIKYWRHGWRILNLTSHGWWILNLTSHGWWILNLTSLFWTILFWFTRSVNLTRSGCISLVP